MKDFDLTLYLVTDSNNLSQEDFLDKIEKALKGGVTLVQLREKVADGLAFFTLAEKLKELTDKYNVPLIIDDRIDIAMAVNAAGVHLGQSDIPIDVARKLLGENKIIGATAKTLEQALVAQKKGADYLGVGAIYPTTTKVKTVLTSVTTLKDICINIDIPVVAIGGLNKDNIDILKNSKVRGVAVVSAIMQSGDIVNDTKSLKEKILDCVI